MDFYPAKQTSTKLISQKWLESDMHFVMLYSQKSWIQSRF